MPNISLENQCFGNERIPRFVHFCTQLNSCCYLLVGLSELADALECWPRASLVKSMRCEHQLASLTLKEPPGLLPFSVTSFSFYLSLLLGYNDLRPYELQTQLSHQNSPNLSLDILFPACPSLWPFMPCTGKWAFGNVSACDSRTVAILPSRGHLVMCGDVSVVTIEDMLLACNA